MRFSMLRTTFAMLLGLMYQSVATAQTEIDLTLRMQLGRAEQIIIPQSRGFFVPQPNRPTATANMGQFGQAIQIDSVEARVNVLEQTASTTMEVRLRNPGSQQTEAILLLPVPEGAVVSAFTFEGAASEPTAQILTRDEARRLYDAIVAKVRDPALLEFAGYNLIRTSVFPIAAGGTQKIRLTYENILAADGDRVDFVLPRSESLDRRAPWKVSVEIKSKQPISTVYSPSHEITTVRRSDTHITATLADASRLDPGAFRLSYLRARNGNDVSASLFAYPDPKVGGGYFLLMAGLPASLAEQRPLIKRELTIVFDRSGSMAGAKMDQARAAAIQVLEGLNNGEDFNIIDFSTTVAMFSPEPVTLNDANRREARKYIESIRPSGGTNIHDALVEALRDRPNNRERLPIVLFLTDGLPTVGQTAEVAIREVVEKGNAQSKRIFTFGVGNDVNVPLLDRIADITRASTTYVLPEEDVELKVAATFKRLHGPVLSDLSVQTLDDNGQPTTRLVRDLIPNKLPDLFEGDQLILLGQYQKQGPVKFALTGNFLNQKRTFEFAFDMSNATTMNAFVPRLWAGRRIAYLVDQIRQAGAATSNQPALVGANIFNDPRFKELTDEILRLSTEFGILTEYTAFLATEGTNLNDWEALRVGCGTVLNDRAVKTRSGQAAVNQGINFNDQKGQVWGNSSKFNRYVDQNLTRVEITNVQQVCDRAFFKRGNQWIDSRIVNDTAQQQEIAADSVITYGSPEHLELLHKLIAQNRQGVLSLDGDIMIQFEGHNILVRNEVQERSN
jgi:Ca-activated chloride channel homolog